MVEDGVKPIASSEEAILGVLVEKDCSACKEIEETYKEDIERGEVVIIPVDETELGRRLAEEFKLDSVPTWVEITKVEDGFRVCGSEECVDISLDKKKK